MGEGMLVSASHIVFSFGLFFIAELVLLYLILIQLISVVRLLRARKPQSWEEPTKRERTILFGNKAVKVPKDMNLPKPKTMILDDEHEANVEETLRRRRDRQEI